MDPRPAVLAATAALAASVAHAGPFTVIGLPDTQNYSELYPEIFLAQTQWIERQRAALDVRFVSHYGDVVQHGDDVEEWQNAEVALAVLDAMGIPWGVTPGNHDVTPAGISGSPYIPQFFRDRYGADHWAGRPWVLEVSPSGMSNAQRFNAGGVSWLWLHLECDLPVREMAWAQGLLDRHRDQPVFLTTHRWLQDAEDYTAGVPVVPSGRYPEIWYAVEGVYTDGGVRSEDAWRWFVRKNASIFMVNCGHFHEEFRQTSTNVRGLPVHEVLADYQDDPNGGDGWLRIMEVDPGLGEIRVESYSPTLDQSRSADESRFTLPVDFGAYGLAPGTRFAAFQESINGYAGTWDTWISEADPDAVYGDDDIRESDDDVLNALFGDDRGQALVRFGGLFEGAGGPIPAGAEIVEAHLYLEIVDDIDTPLFDPDFLVYEVTRFWNEASTWNSLGGGLTPGEDLGDLVATFGGDNDPDADGMRRIDVTSAVRKWSNGELTNFGLAILPEIIPGNDDGISILTSESANPIRRPRLEIVWADPTPPCPADADGDGAVGFGDLLGQLAVWGPCPFCPGDLDRNGEVGFDDLLALLAAWGDCGG